MNQICQGVGEEKEENKKKKKGNGESSRRSDSSAGSIVGSPGLPSSSSSRMKVFVVLAVLVAVASAQLSDPLAQPTPYSFSYNSNTEDGGSSGHQESGDGSGRVTGSYTVTDLEGHNRVVDYIADENGFRATVRTNEPGTANLNSADVTMESTGDDGGIAAAYSGSLSANAYAGTYPAAAPAPAVASGRPGVRYVLVPVTDPRARGYY
ncbi:hypothetical protein AVEN_101713-1 [Araneus ventricosus]|uniref:Cuticle protein 10.9 n=1 Tax=Araneus ventricosus TaxID=182803 RepID=A0A4Y2LF29_ARAVE|nr:hypothetical protein AVEN_101713-1 [Araneus ventricosus]